MHVPGPGAVPVTLGPDDPRRSLVDDRTGIIRRLTAAPTPASMVRGFRMVEAVLADTTTFSDWPVDSGGAGCSLDDDDVAVGAAIGEAVERYCGNLVPPGLVRGTARELREAGHDVVDLGSFALYSPDQHSLPGFPYTRLHDDLDLEWARARDALDGGDVLVPATLVWVAYPGAARRRGAPHITPIVQAGLAAGQDVDHAVDSALEEILERDAMALAWHGRAPLRLLRPPACLADLYDGKLYANSGYPASGVIEALGLTNEFSDLKENFAVISTEQALARKPDALIVMHAGKESPQAAVDAVKKLLAGTGAVRAGHVHAASDRDFQAGGVAVIDHLEQVATKVFSDQAS